MATTCNRSGNPFGEDAFFLVQTGRGDFNARAEQEPESGDLLPHHVRKETYLFIVVIVIIRKQIVFVGAYILTALTEALLVTLTPQVDSYYLYL